MTLFIGNLAWRTTEQDLDERLSQYGDVLRLNLVRDNEGQSRGFAFAEMACKDALLACEQLDRCEVNGRPLKIRPAHKK